MRIVHSKRGGNENEELEWREGSVRNVRMHGAFIAKPLTKRVA